MGVLNLKRARHKCPPPIRDHDRTDFKLGDMAPIKNHAHKDAFDSKYKPGF